MQREGLVGEFVRVTEVTGWLHTPPNIPPNIPNIPAGRVLLRLGDWKLAPRQAETTAKRGCDK